MEMSFIVPVLSSADCGKSEPVVTVASEGIIVIRVCWWGAGGSHPARGHGEALIGVWGTAPEAIAFNSYVS